MEDTVRYLHAGVLSRSPCFSEGLAQALGDVVEHQSFNQRGHFFPLLGVRGVRTRLDGSMPNDPAFAGRSQGSHMPSWEETQGRREACVCVCYIYVTATIFLSNMKPSL